MKLASFAVETSTPKRFSSPRTGILNLEFVLQLSKSYGMPLLSDLIGLTAKLIVPRLKS